ncbi:Uu.00g084380.m01.CDS01 [Anthostomella pinea]|uniref:Uu.00g084380.m01.CDS01 n=1 Tax=Anthostomella pinea TaxID=933095 RepID=A0AAI8VMD7_9PEZI|nr:Uu.00g084380.m01.CDS01 [Anthostomella pinea]
MRFFAQLAAFAATAVTLASANSVTFVNQDATKRTIYFTGTAPVDKVEIAGNAQMKVSMPISWIGNAYSVSEGAENVPGMLAEFTFQGWNDLTWFDVSAIVKPADINGVKEIYPATEVEATLKSKYSGCSVFPCPTVYYHPNDVQTVSTPETDLICTLGNSNVLVSRDVGEGLVSRNYVLGKL